MGGLLGELGKKLADRWLSLLVLPGALYLAVMAVAHTLGQAHALDLQRLTDQITAWAGSPSVRTAGGQTVLLAAVLGGAAGIGLAAQALGSLVERIHLAADWRSWPAPARALARRARDSRNRRWKHYAREWHRLRNADGARAAMARLAGTDLARTEEQATELRTAWTAMTRIAPEAPDRPTWTGDRVNAAALRLGRDQNLDLAALWPHLWLVLPDTVRGEITTARQGLTRAAALSAWALLYLPLAAWWWPALLTTTVLAVAGRQRTRAAADTYATLLEATVRLHARDLVARLDPNPADDAVQDTNAALMRQLTPSMPPEPEPDTDSEPEPTSAPPEPATEPEGAPAT
ncbi:hypothetical protein [Streptomyces sp. NRRL B-24484]|uniref:hypothetical protein n=1 Tax=Streptomyces sp. NRRL B-24484 TaxID=1463833 RepID=UPI000693E22B|nr:hypothetical protein [Streptomyces sp. NRRL B-24484]